MSDERDEREEQEGGSKIRIVDRRMLNDDERAGKAPVPSESDRPKLEVLSGAQQPEPNEVPDAPAEDDQFDEDSQLDPQYPSPMGDPSDEEMPPMTAEEMQQMQAEFEAAAQEQFAEIEGRMGRPLTEKEKQQVRAEMEQQAMSMTALEVAPLLQQMMAEMSARAAVHLGLMPNPYTRLIARNDGEARLAIDTFGALFDVLKPHMDSESQREFARVLNDLRVNYASVTGTKPTGSGGGGYSGYGGPSRIIH